MYLFNSPWWLRVFYPSLVWRIPTEEKVVYLTFDDGPHPEITPWVLDKLYEKGFKASFFCIGENVRKYPETFSQIMESGHQVGNHTQRHLNGFKTSTQKYLKDTDQCKELVDGKIFRPPFGRITWSQIKALKKNYDIIMWTVVSGDFDQSLNIKKAKAALEKYTVPGSIVVFHDSQKAFPQLRELLPWYLDLLENKGFTSKAL